MKWFRWLLVLVMLAVAGGALFVAMGGITLGGAAATDTLLTAQAARRTVTKAVAATGTVGSAATYGLVFGDDAHLGASTSSIGAGASTTWPVSSVAVSVGDSVKQGQTLATADTTDLNTALDKLQTSLASAQVTLQQAEQAKDTAIVTAKQQLAAAIITVHVDKLNLKTANENLNNAVGSDAHRQARIQDIQAQSAVTQAEQQEKTLEQTVAGTFPSETAAIESAQSNLDDLTTQVADQEALIAHATITSPVDGVVSAVNVVKGFDAPAGDAIDVDTTTLQVVADVVETDLPSVSVGQAATVTITAVSANVTGKVTSIAPAATSSGSSSVVTYPVTVTLDSPGETVRAGMSANVSITTAQAQNVIAVPSAAVLGTNGNYTVDVADGSGGETPVAVTIGLVTDTYTEIQSGINEGDTVVIGTVSSTAQSAGGSTTTTGGFTLGGGLGGGGGFGGGNFGGGGTRVGR